MVPVMQLLTKQTDYAIRALIYLALNRDDFVSTSKISKSERIPYQFLRRILQILRKNDLVESKEGVAGGIRIKTDAKNIRVLDIIKHFQGNIELSSCMFRRRLCENRNKCVLRARLRKIENIIIQQFKDITIASLINDINKERVAATFGLRQGR